MIGIPFNNNNKTVCILSTNPARCFSFVFDNPRGIFASKVKEEKMGTRDGAQSICIKMIGTAISKTERPSLKGRWIGRLFGVCVCERWTRTSSLTQEIDTQIQRRPAVFVVPLFRLWSTTGGTPLDCWPFISQRDHSTETCVSSRVN